MTGSRRVAGVAIALCVLCVAAIATFASVARAAGSVTVTTCGAGVFTRRVVAGFTTTFFCPAGTHQPPGMTIAPGHKQVSRGRRAAWQADAPTGFVITGASVASHQMYSIHINDGQSWGGGFYWAGGGAAVHDGKTQYSVSGLHSRYFGFRVVCNWKSCTGSKHPAQLTVESIDLHATETQGPQLSAPAGLWQASGWVRGTWTLNLSGNSPSGICTLSASLNGQAIPGTSSTPNPRAWHQCAAHPVVQSIQTGSYGEGAVPMTIRGVDAAGVGTSDAKTVYIDNSQPVVSYAGSPTDALSTAGVQYVTASASGSPSGIDGLSCSLDGGPAQWTAGPTARIAVSGVGSHSVACTAANNATDGSGMHGWSSAAKWALSIRQPTVSSIGFAKHADPLRCRKVHKRIHVPARWVTVHRHHRPVWIKKPAHTKIVTVEHCHERVVRRRITVWRTVRRNGTSVRVKRRKIIHVAVAPHTVMRRTRRVAHGKSTKVSGWLGLPDGSAAAGQTVRVLTAPANGLGKFRQAAVVRTRSNGSWTAKLRPGPSRLVEAVYGGATTLEPSDSEQVQEIVPARIRLLRVSPHRVPWSSPGHASTVRIVGKLDGGHLPPGGALVRLRIGQGSHYTTYGVQEHVTGNGRFSTTYTFGDGLPSVKQKLWFQVASLPMGDYPWAPAASNKRTVIVGGHPQAHRRRLRHHAHPETPRRRR